MLVPLVCVILASLAAAIFDLRTHRIPNALAGALFLCGLTGNFLIFGWHAALIGLILTFAVLVAGSFAFSWKLIGGGDVKMLAAATGTLGYPLGLWFLLYTLISGGIIAVAYSAISGRLSATLSNLKNMGTGMLYQIKPTRPADGLPMPYALAIFAGAVCAGLSIGPSLLRLYH